MDKQEKILSKINLDEEVRVVEIDAEGELRRRFFDLGIIKNTIIEPLYISPFGDPKAYLIRGTVIAIRHDEANKIRVRTISKE
ncbi:MAG TPA: FeoA family protein [Clostridium sp.]